MKETAEDLLIARISSYLKDASRCIIAIEGKAAAGKTTLAALLEERLDASVIHMDDFFLPIELRTKERYREPGGNIHYERFNEEVALKLGKEKSFKYQAFNCIKMQLDSWQEVADKKIVIIEGAYSMHPQIMLNYNLRIFLDIENGMQQLRILRRNGIQGLKQFNEKWIPMEKAYFEKYHIVEQCDMVLTI